MISALGRNTGSYPRPEFAEGAFIPSTESGRDTCLGKEYEFGFANSSALE